MVKNMQTMTLTHPQSAEKSPLHLTDVVKPIPRPHEVLIKVTACGICRTDLHIIEGELESIKSPLIPGHQVVGKVERLGQNVTTFKIGDRVGAGWLSLTCGSCHFCKSGRENLCEKAEFTGYTRNGGYADYIVINESFAHPLPLGLDDIHIAPLLCAGAIGYRAYKFAQVKRGDVLGLIGFGASAHLVIQVARYFGVKVYVFTREENHKKLAKELGAVWVGGVEEVPPQKLTAMILFAPVGDLVPKLLPHLERGGRLVINAIHMTPIPQLDYSLLWPERAILNVANGTRRDVEEFLKLAAEISLKTTVITYPLPEANEALFHLKHGLVTGAVVLTP